MKAEKILLKTDASLQHNSGSYKIPIPPKAVEKLGLKKGDRVNITVYEDRIVLEK
jgi:AbrB family looped-hinge helix DNA binding protein